MSTKDRTPSGNAGSPSDSRRGPQLRQQEQQASTGQQKARQRADLAQHGVQIHEQSRNVDRGATGKK